MRFHKACVCLLVVMSLASCVKRPKNVLSDSEMASLVADMALAEAYVQTIPPTKAAGIKEGTVNYVLEKHGLTRAEFDTTMAWYGRNMDAYYEMCDLASKELNKRKRKIAGSSSVEVETSDLWCYPRQSLLSRKAASNAFEFSIPTSDIDKGQRINLKFKVNNPATGSAMLGVEYDTGEKAYLSRFIHASKRVDLTFQTDTGRVVSRIFGNMLVSDGNRLPLWIDSIYLSALPYDTTEYYIIHSQRKYVEPKQRRRPKVKEQTDSVS